MISIKPKLTVADYKRLLPAHLFEKFKTTPAYVYNRDDYITIANSRINADVSLRATKKQKGKTIHVCYVIDMKWEDLQRTEFTGSDKFNIMVSMFNHYRPDLAIKPRKYNQVHPELWESEPI